MAGILSGLHHASASVVVRSCQSTPNKQNPINAPLWNLCRQGSLGASVSVVGFTEIRKHPQCSYYVKPTETFTVRATGSITQLAAVSSEVAADDAAKSFEIPDPISASDVRSLAGELSGNGSAGTSGFLTPLEDVSRLGQDSIQTGESPSTIVTGDFPAESLSAESVPSLVDGIESTPSSSDPAVDVLKSITEDDSGGEIISSVKERYLRATEDTQDFAQFKTDDFGASLKVAESRIKALQNDFGASLKAAGDGIEAARDAAANSVDSFVSSVRDAVDTAGSFVGNFYHDLNGSIVRTIKSFTGTSEKSAEGLQSTGDGASAGSLVDFTSIFRTGTPANDGLKDIVVVVKTATGSALAVAGDVILHGYKFTKDNLPEDFQSILNSAEEKVSELSGSVGSAIDQVLVIITDGERAVGIEPDNAAIPVIFVVGGSLLLQFVYLISRYGGYSGDLLPRAALDLVEDGNAALVDIRPQDIRETQGIPDFRRSARSKYATVELVKVEGPVRSQLRSVNDVELVLTAAVIRGLKNVNQGSKIIVLDSDGGKSKQIARGLRRIGFRRVYRVDGGFEAWASSGLRCKLEGSVNPLIILQEDAQAIVEEIKPTAFGVLAVLFGVVAGTYAVIEWEETLQLIGLVGLAATTYSRFETYETVEDVKADLRIFQKPFNLVTQGIIWIVGLVEPRKLQLATSPASSNVQGRVIQAAAKHGPISSELELIQDESTSVSSVEDAGGDDGTQDQHTKLQEREQQGMS